MAFVAATAIVNPARILLPAVILQQLYTERMLYPAVDVHRRRALRFLAVHRLLVNRRRCAACQRDMSLTRSARAIDGYRWCCPQCASPRSVRSGSFFAKSHLKLNDLTIMMYKWCQEIPFTSIMREVELKSWQTMT